jgi:hypothetical protein
MVPGLGETIVANGDGDDAFRQLAVDAEMAANQASTDLGVAALTAYMHEHDPSGVITLDGNPDVTVEGRPADARVRDDYVPALYLG